jgi:hypothetical protein
MTLCLGRQSLCSTNLDQPMEMTVVAVINTVRITSFVDVKKTLAAELGLPATRHTLCVNGNRSAR